MNTLSVFSPRYTSDLFEAMDRNFLDNFSVFPSMPKLSVPSVDVRETKTSYMLEMDLPGYAEDDVEINLKGRVLSISSKKADLASTEGEKYEEKIDGEWLIRERNCSSFARRFTLPNDINAEQVEAHFKNGVLAIEIPRKPESQAKTIAINAK